MTTSNRLGVEARLSTAIAYLQNNDPVSARRLLVNAKIGAIGLGLEDLVHYANRSLAVSHLDEANLHYNAGRLEEADKKYPEAENAYTEFSGSFEEPTLLEHLGNLYNSWASATFQLGQTAHNNGSGKLTSAAGDGELVLTALGLWDSALQWYYKTIQVYDKARSKEVTIDSAFKTVPEQEIANIRSAAVRWANSIRRPDVAERYLPK